MSPRKLGFWGGGGWLRVRGALRGCFFWGATQPGFAFRPRWGCGSWGPAKVPQNQLGCAGRLVALRGDEDDPSRKQNNAPGGSEAPISSPCARPTSSARIFLPVCEVCPCLPPLPCPRDPPRKGNRCERGCSAKIAMDNAEASLGLPGTAVFCVVVFFFIIFLLI